MIDELNELMEKDIEGSIIKIIQRLRETSYARGYKDGFNDGKESEYQKHLFNGEGK